MEPLNEDDPGVIGPYRIVGVLGEGGMGRVFLGVDGDGTSVIVLTDCPDNAAHWKIHQSGGAIQLESAYVPGQCMPSAEWDQLFASRLSLAACAGTADGSQWYTEQAAGGGYVRIHNTAPGNGLPPQDTCLRTGPVTTSEGASIDDCVNVPEERWLVGA